MKQTLTIMMVPIDAVGHVNAHMGIGQELLKRGHTVVMTTTHAWKGKLAPLGFVEKCYGEPPTQNDSVMYQNEIMQAATSTVTLSSIEKYEQLYPHFYAGLLDQLKSGNEDILKIVEHVRPHIIISDGIYVPALMSQQEIPWIACLSLNPLGNFVGNVPPGWSGYASRPIKQELWNDFNQRSRRVMEPIFEDFKTWVLENGGPELVYNYTPLWTNHSPFGNIYMYPEELSYESIRPDPPNFHRFDNFMRHEAQNFEFPSSLASLPGKNIYFSMGTIGASELILMKKIIGILSKSPNRFIVSKGPHGDQFQLAENMWGANHVSQTNVLPVVDLVITHGGNNTVTEAFYFGKRVLVLPLFCDQLDNGQRILETGLGLSLDPGKVTEEELLVAIETILGDVLLERRMSTIGTRIRGSNSVVRVADLIEHIATNKK